MLALTFAVFIGMLTCISAADSGNATEIQEIGNDDVIGEASDGGHVSAGDNESIMQSDGHHSFTELQSLMVSVDHEEYEYIDLEHDYAYNPDVDSENLKNGVNISGGCFKIFGNNHVIYGNGARIFNIGSDATVDIYNLQFNANSTCQDGGSIYNSGTLSLKMCELSNGHAGNNGGAILNSKDGYLDITNCRFFNYTADNCGGAVASYGQLNVNQSSFVECGSKFGGAIATFDYALISNSNFSSNVASYSGGAVYKGVNPNGTLYSCSVDRSNFYANRADNGGAIYNAIASYCYFDKNNNAKYYGNIMYGGASVNCTCETASDKNYYGTIQSAGFSFKISSFDLDYNESLLTIEILVTGNPTGQPVSGVGIILHWEYDDHEWDDSEYDDYEWADGDDDIRAANWNDDFSWWIYQRVATDEDGIASFHINKNRFDYHKHNHLNIYLYDRIQNSSSISGRLEDFLDIGSGVSFSNDIAFDYGGKGSSNFTLTNATGIKAIVDDHPEAVISIVNNTVFVSGLESGNYVLLVETIPYDYANSYLTTLNVTVRKISKVTFTAGMVFEYGGSGVIHMVVEGGTVNINNIEVVGHPEALIGLSNNDISVSNLPVGSYTLRVVSTPEEGLAPGIGTVSINVRKATAVIRASKLTVAYKKGTKWTVRLADSKTGKPIANMELTLKVFTGSKYKTVKIRTNSKGEATYQTKSLSKGTHKIIVSATHSGYDFNTLTSSIKVIKQKMLKFKVNKKTLKDGASLAIKVTRNKKPINGVKVKLLIYTGKKLTKTVILKTKKVGKNKGVVGYATNELSVGTHKVVIMPVDIKYGGSAKSSMKITKKAKRYSKITTKISG